MRNGSNSNHSLFPHVIVSVKNYFNRTMFDKDTVGGKGNFFSEPQCNSDLFTENNAPDSVQDM